MEVIQIIFSLILLSVIFQSLSWVIAYVYEVYDCKCDYFLPSYLIEARTCGYSATCFWSLHFYLSQMKAAGEGAKEDGIPSLDELRKNYTTTMMRYELPLTWPLQLEGECATDLETCEGYMKKLFTRECKRLENSSRLGNPVLFTPNENPKIYDIFLTEHWRKNRSGYIAGRIVHRRQNNYIVKCPSTFYLNSYHFTLNRLLGAINVEYHATMSVKELLHLIPRKIKKIYTCNATSWVRYHLFRNISEHYTKFCQRAMFENKTYNGYICDTEDDPKIKATIKKGLSALCDTKSSNAFRHPIYDAEHIIDSDMESQFEEECDLRDDCEINDYAPIQFDQ